MSASLASGLITRVASWRARFVGPKAHFGSDKQIAEVFLSLERDQGESLKNLSQVWIALEDVEISPEDVADGKVVRVVRDDGHWSVFVIISLPVEGLLFHVSNKQAGVAWPHLRPHGHTSGLLVVLLSESKRV